MDIRLLCEAREEQFLSPYAFLSKNTKGRARYEEPCETRTEFQRDRDRIIHCKAFRRLMHKTQVFLSPEGDHYRTRLTHTLEVTQIARTIARALCLNEDLTEAIALGHDLGHTPFGHAGEVILQKCADSEFAHYRQSLRVVDKIENGGQGLNLTAEVRDGIVNHTGDDIAATLEGVIVKYADRIAYINHDIDDAIRGDIIRSEDIPAELSKVLGDRHSARINTMVTAVIDASLGRPEIRMTAEVAEATLALRTFLFDNVYKNPVAKGEEDKAKQVIAALYDYFTTHPDELPAEFSEDGEEPLSRRVCDYIAGMTDRYAISVYENLFIPKVWIRQ